MRVIVVVVMLLSFAVMVDNEPQVFPAEQYELFCGETLQMNVRLSKIYSDVRSLNLYSVTTPELIEAIYEHSEAFNIPYQILIALIYTESSFRQFAVSYADCVGYMQINPAVHTWIDRDRMFETNYNIYAGCTILRKYYDRTGDWEQALIRYNGWFRGNPFGRLVLSRKAKLRG